MFICDRKNQEIKFFDGKSIKKISGDFNSIFLVIQKKYNKIDNFYIGYHGNKICNYQKNVFVFIPKFGKLFEIDSKFAKEVGIIRILSCLNVYKGTDLDHGNKIVHCEIYGFPIKKRQVKINNYQDFIKETFIFTTTKDKDTGEYISYSQAPFFRGNYSKQGFVENTGVGVDINKKIAIEKSLSENIERASASEFLYKNTNFKRKSFVSLSKYNQEIINLYNNECDITDFLNGVELKGLTINKNIFLPDFLIFYPTRHKYKYNTCSSGMATHLTLKKAVLGGILELIERDSFIYSRLSRSKKVYRIDNSFVNKIQAPLKSGFHFSFFLLDSIVPIPTILAIMEKGGKKCISLGTDFLLENAIKKAFQEGINSKVLFNRRGNLDDNSGIMQHIYYYLNPENGSKLDWLFHAPILKVDNMEQEISNYNLLLSWCKNNNINFFFYEFENCLNQNFGRKTVRVFSPDLLPVYFGKEIPGFILRNQRIEKLNFINRDLHPLG